MRVICDIETDALENPKHIWCIVCIDIDTEKEYVFREDYKDFREFSRNVTTWIGHNFLNFDAGVLRNRNLADVDLLSVLDTLVLSKLFYFSIPGGHSLAAWGERLGYKKSGYDDFSKWSQELEDRCIIDCRINLELYKYFKRFLDDPQWQASIEVEHQATIVLDGVRRDGYPFDYRRAQDLYASIFEELQSLDNTLLEVFHPLSKLVREVNPRETKHGTLNRSDFRWLGPNPDLSSFAPNDPFSVFEWVEFNPSSPTQIVERLNEASWKPTQRTKGYLSAKAEKDYDKLNKYHKDNTGWAVSEENLETLPDSAPEAARSLVRRLMLASRVRRLEEWFGAYNASTGCIHGTVNSIGTWTHRSNHVKPNMGNVPSLDSKYTSKELKEIAHELGIEMRSLWGPPPNTVQIGCDAESIQLRIFAHYINDAEFTNSLVSGNKEDGTDPHSLNSGVLGEGVTRAQAKTYIYAFLLGVGMGKTQLIFGCSLGEAKERRDRFIARYPGLEKLRKEDIPRDIANGYFTGFDGRKVIIPKDEGNMIGYVLGGYLQNGESCIMKHAMIRWRRQLVKEKVWFRQLAYVHDEWQSAGFERDAEHIGMVQASAIRTVGEDFNLTCPMAGQYKIGRNWYETH